MLKRKDSTGSDVEFVRRNVAHGMDDVKELICSLRQDGFGSYGSIQHNVDRSSLAGNNHQKKMIYREAKALRQGLHDALSDAADGVQMSFADTPETVKRRVSLVAGHSKRNALANQGLSSADSANSEERQNRSRAAPESVDVPTGNTS